MYSCVFFFVSTFVIFVEIVVDTIIKYGEWCISIDFHFIGNWSRRAHTQRTKYRYCQHFFNWFYGENRSLIKFSTIILTKWFHFLCRLTFTVGPVAPLQCSTIKNAIISIANDLNAFLFRAQRHIPNGNMKLIEPFKTVSPLPHAHPLRTLRLTTVSDSPCHLINLLLYLKIAGKRVIMCVRWENLFRFWIRMKMLACDSSEL